MKRVFTPNITLSKILFTSKIKIKIYNWKSNNLIRYLASLWWFMWRLMKKPFHLTRLSFFSFVNWLVDVINYLFLRLDWKWGPFCFWGSSNNKVNIFLTHKLVNHLLQLHLFFTFSFLDLGHSLSKNHSWIRTVKIRTNTNDPFNSFKIL